MDKDDQIIMDDVSSDSDSSWTDSDSDFDSDWTDIDYDGSDSDTDERPPPSIKELGAIIRDAIYSPPKLDEDHQIIRDDRDWSDCDSDWSESDWSDSDTNFSDQFSSCSCRKHLAWKAGHIQANPSKIDHDGRRELTKPKVFYEDRDYGIVAQRMDEHPLEKAIKIYKQYAKRSKRQHLGVSIHVHGDYLVFRGGLMPVMQTAAYLEIAKKLPITCHVPFLLEFSSDGLLLGMKEEDVRAICSKKQVEIELKKDEDGILEKVVMKGTELHIRQAVKELMKNQKTEKL